MPEWAWGLIGIAVGGSLTYLGILVYLSKGFRR